MPVAPTWTEQSLPRQQILPTFHPCAAQAAGAFVKETIQNQAPPSAGKPAPPPTFFRRCHKSARKRRAHSWKADLLSRPAWLAQPRLPAVLQQTAGRTRHTSPVLGGSLDSARWREETRVRLSSCPTHP